MGARLTEFGYNCAMDNRTKLDDEIECQTARNRDPGSAWKRDPSLASGQACPGSEQEGPARVA